MVKKGGQRYYSPDPNDQQAESRQKGRESPDNERVDAMQHEFSVATKKLSSQLTKQRSQHQALKEEVKLLRTATAEYREQLKEASSDISKLRKAIRRIKSQSTVQSSLSLRRSPLRAFMAATPGKQQSQFCARVARVQCKAWRSTEQDNWRRQQPRAGWKTWYNTPAKVAVWISM